MVKHGDYPTATKDIWEFPYGGRATDEDLKRQAVAARSGYAITQASKHWFVDDTEHPYTEIKRFDWIRGYHVGGRSIMWGRQSYRWSPMDFEANAKDGIAVDWPIRYAELAPWYDHVESFIGVSGQAEGLAAAARRQVPAADGPQLRRDSSAAGDGGQVQAQADDRPRRAPDGAARAQPAARHVPVSQPVHSRLSVRRVLQQQLEHAARGGSDRQHDAAAEFDRVRADLRRAASGARPACACSTPRPTSTWSSPPR